MERLDTVQKHGDLTGLVDLHTEIVAYVERNGGKLDSENLSDFQAHVGRFVADLNTEEGAKFRAFRAEMERILTTVRSDSPGGRDIWVNFVSASLFWKMIYVKASKHLMEIDLLEFQGLHCLKDILLHYIESSNIRIEAVLTKYTRARECLRSFQAVECFALPAEEMNPVAPRVDILSKKGFLSYHVDRQSSPGFVIFTLEPVKRCIHCAEEIPRDMESKCGGCGIVRYCSRECQRRDWRAHSDDCKRFRKAPRDDAPSHGGFGE